MANSTRKKIVVIEDHDDVYYYWKKNNVRNVELVHIDPHCDLAGSLINLSNQYLMQIREGGVDEGNWLVFAVIEGMVRKLEWVFDEYGDRKFDDDTVKFETDLSARLPTAKSKYKNLLKFPITYKKTKFEDWQGFSEGNHLSLDWDFFSFIIKQEENIDHDCEEFLKMPWDVMPDVTYICYSHDYVHPSCIKFIEFIHRLAEKIDAEVVYFQPDKKRLPLPSKSIPLKVWDKAYHTIRVWLRRRGIY